MTPRPPRAWPAQEPSVDFADRTVGAILRDRASRSERERRRRWVGALVIAAVFVTGGAWARGVLSARKAPSAPALSAAPQARRATESVAVEAAPAAVRQPPEASREQVPPVTSTAHRSPHLSAPPDAGRHVRVPMCNCAQTICDCGGEP
jgi:hypothetical protein